MATHRICKSFFITPEFNQRFMRAAESAGITQLAFFISSVEEKIAREGLETEGDSPATDLENGK